ncbi:MULTISPECIES: hypothetical protein [unclassified Mycobacterium]|uniref:hypothetical protein n=1 Tax=unclassified Mycobacterium TaxID=2642494 RepID=UPI00073FE9E3|nr:MULTISPECIES: hypothetical protein [unclassified Mycobacterium]KUH86475.1 hypothetical protein AU187_06910 [Mycobacterium sp. IS-1556]KUH86600.1 hypothetical protein AU185_18445 [Mycobacterium sp. GA-0227b]KUH91877.1 hypothetical protein AU186_05160 [Mycobacterium sp. GA-1999]
MAPFLPIRPESLSATRRVHQGRYAGLIRDRAPDDAELLEAKRLMVVGNWLSALEKLIAQNPPMNADEHAYAASLLSDAGA